MRSEDEYSQESQPEQLPPIEIQPEQLSDEALTGVIENFIVREGTDYGAQEVTHDTKIAQIRRQIDRGQIIVTFDPNTESVSLLTKLEWQARRASN